MPDIYCPKCGEFEADSVQPLFCERCGIEKKVYVETPHEPVVIREAKHSIIADISPYQSMADGTMIMGRKQHRDHLKRHSLIEVGNETKHLKPYGDYTPKGVKKDLIESMQRYKAQHRK